MVGLCAGRHEGEWCYSRCNEWDSIWRTKIQKVFLYLYGWENTKGVEK